MPIGKAGEDKIQFDQGRERRATKNDVNVVGRR